MSACPNCGKKLSCGCQRKTASNGRTVCTTCASNYEASLKPTQPKVKESPVLNSLGKDRYNNLQKFTK
jgi:transcription elongation factor Elf1